MIWSLAHLSGNSTKGALSRVWSEQALKGPFHVLSKFLGRKATIPSTALVGTRAVGQDYREEIVQEVITGEGARRNPF
jgi:hypothetical protein